MSDPYFSKPDIVDPTPAVQKGNTKEIIEGVAIGLLVIIVIVCVVYCCWKKVAKTNKNTLGVVYDTNYDRTSLMEGELDQESSS